MERERRASDEEAIGGTHFGRTTRPSSPAAPDSEARPRESRARLPRTWARTAAATIALGVAGCVSSSRPVEPSPIGSDASPVDEVDTAQPETRVLRLRYRRPFVNGQPGYDFALIRFLEESLSEDGRLEYRREDNSVIVTDYRPNLHAIETVVHLLDFSGLPVPPDLGHLPFRVEEEAQIVPNLPPRR